MTFVLAETYSGVGIICDPESTGGGVPLASIASRLEDLIGQQVRFLFDGTTLTGTLAAVNGSVAVLCANGGLCFVNVANIDAVCTD